MFLISSIIMEMSLNDGFSASGNWLWPRAEGLAALGVPNYFAGDNRPGDTNFYCPATWVTFAEAQAIATKLGGQLPTSEQWTSAFNNHRGKIERLRAQLEERHGPDVIAFARANPGKFTYGTPGQASRSHLGMEMIAAREGVQLTAVPM